MMNHNIETAIVEVPVCVPAPKPEGRTMMQHVGVVGIVVFLVSAIVASFWLIGKGLTKDCLLYTSPSPRDKRQSRMPSSA